MIHARNHVGSRWLQEWGFALSRRAAGPGLPALAKTGHEVQAADSAKKPL